MSISSITQILNLLKDSTAHVFAIDKNGKVIAFNDQAKNLIGYDPEEVIGKDFTSFFSEKEQNRIKEHIKNIFSTKGTYEFHSSLRLANSTKIDVVFEGAVCGSGDNRVAFLIIKNEKENIKELIKESFKNECINEFEGFIESIKRHFDFVQKMAHIGVWEIHFKDNRYYWSDEMYNILGLDKTKDKPRSIIDSGLIHPNDKEFVKNIFDRAVKNFSDYKITYRIRRPNGEIRYVDEQAVCLDKDVDPHLMGFDIDVTDRELYQKKLLEQTRMAQRMRLEAIKAKKEAEQANRAKSIFLSNISHEIRTLLNAILGYAQILSQDRELNEKQKEMIGSIIVASGHLLDLINDILEITRIEVGKNRPNISEFNLTNMFKSIYQIFLVRAAAKNIRWSIKGMPKEDLFIHSDKSKLFHILLNLVGNAIKFTEKGSVQLIFKIRKNGKCYFEVKDTGIGIEKELQAKIFEPFVQHSEGYQRGGTGLGLAIAKNNIEILGGELKLESKPGRGTRFYFEIPCGTVTKKKVVKETMHHSSISVKKGSSITALIADDTEENVKVMKSFLEPEGVSIISAKDGEEAVSKFIKNSPDIVFMDVRMPKIDGIEAAKRIKKIDNNVKIVAITASQITENRKDTEDIFDEILIKPFSIKSVNEILIKFFSERFEKARTPKESEKPKMKADLSKLDESVKKQMIVLAKLGQITELKKITQSLQNEAAKEKLNFYLKNFNFDAIIKELEKKDSQ
ncbi:hybrid sensor histidine kinase/response regulator [Nitrosophilus alvini]|uniref:hybrid sensor histidine kinase/response regulator n=1 Tax=Nitrosophilus alvini TaxID=2714855 RepID=UPI00190C0071|nr:hybrid sensor histidine kinase/response regulator [Nitrosophilus alvini]